MKSRKASTEGTKRVKTATPDARPIAIADALRAGLEVRSEVVFAYLYGSAADGRCHDLSDVDVAVFLDPATRAELEARDHGPREELRIRAELCEIVERAAPGCEVDLVLLHRAPPLLSERIVRTGRLVLSRDERVRLHWVVAVKSRYCDLRPLALLLDRAVERRIRSGRFGRPDG